MRDLIIIAICAELDRQGAVYSDDPAHVVAGVKLDLGAMADAILGELGRATAPDYDAIAARLSAIADRLEATLEPPPERSVLDFVDHTHPPVEFFVGPGVDLKDALGLTISGGGEKLGVVVAINDQPNGTTGVRIAPMVGKRGALDRWVNGMAEAGPAVSFTSKGFEAVPLEPAIECTPAERGALKWLRDHEGADSLEWRSAILAADPAVLVEFSALVKRGLVERVPDQREEYLWRMTPLGLRAIEQEPL